jgi:hypothetical protein
MVTISRVMYLFLDRLSNFGSLKDVSYGFLSSFVEETRSN